MNTNKENNDTNFNKKKIVIITMLVFIAFMSVIITVVFMNDKTPVNDTTTTRKSVETIAKNGSTTNKTTKTTTEVNSKATKKATTSKSTKSTTKSITADSTTTKIKTTTGTTTSNNTTTEHRNTTERQTSETPTSAPSTTETPAPSTQKSTTTEEATTTHTHSYEVVSSKSATCTTDGSATYRCSCGDSYTEPIKATGRHSWETTYTKKTIHHDEVGHAEVHEIADDGFDFDAAGYTDQQIIDYCYAHKCGYGDAEAWIVDTEAYDEVVDVPTTTCTVCGATK